MDSVTMSDIFGRILNSLSCLMRVILFNAACVVSGAQEIFHIEYSNKTNFAARSTQLISSLSIQN